MKMLFANKDAFFKSAWFICAAVLLVCGCQTVPKSDIETAAQNLMLQMHASPRFLEKCEAVKQAKGCLPIVVLGKIENKTTNRMQGRLDAMRDTIRKSLYDAGLVDIKDDETVSRPSFVARTDEEKTAALVQSHDKQDAPDFIVLGDIRQFTDVGGYHTYRLRLAIHSLTTGVVIWEGIQTMVKLYDERKNK